MLRGKKIGTSKLLGNKKGVVPICNSEKYLNLGKAGNGQ